MKNIAIIRLGGKPKCNGCEKCKEETAKAEESKKISETLGKELREELDKVVHELAVRAALDEIRKELPNTVDEMMQLITQRVLDDTKQRISYRFTGKGKDASTPYLTIYFADANELLKVDGKGTMEVTVENLQTVLLEIMKADFEALEADKEDSNDDE